MEYCTHCGKEIEEGSDFCPECGAKRNCSNTAKSWYNIDIFHIAIAPVVQGFDNGNFFRGAVKVVIDIIAFGFLVSQPLYAYQMWKSDTFLWLNSTGKAVLLSVSILMLLFAIFSFGYWMKRLNRIDHIFNTNDDFVVIPLGTFLLQWLGEWIALLLGIGGIFAIILSMMDFHSSPILITTITSYGWIGGGCAIITGVLIVFVFRIIAERFRAVTAIANNTKKCEAPHQTTSLRKKETNELYYNILYAITIISTVGFMLAAMFK